MSFDLYLECFRAGSRSPFSRQHFERIFSPHVAAREAALEYVILIYPDGGGGTVYIDNCEEIDGFSVNRPGGEELFNDLFLLMKDVGAVVYWPGTGQCLVVAEPSILAELPPDLVAATGPAIKVTSGTDIMEAIARS